MIDISFSEIFIICFDVILRNFVVLIFVAFGAQAISFINKI